MNTDGTGEVDFSTPVYPFSALAWSPDGAKIAFVSRLDGGLYLVNSDGSGQTLLYNDPSSCGYVQNYNSPCTYDPSWSPDGTRIAFGMIRPMPFGNGIYIINSDGTGFSRLTVPSDGFLSEELHPSWSADGKTIIFASNRNNPCGTCGNLQIFSVDVGTSVVTLINGSISQYEPYPDCRRCNRFDTIP